MEYSIRGREVFSEKGRLVATLDADGNPVMAPGMAGPHSKGVREFLDRSFAEEVVRENLAAADPERPAEEGNTTVFVGTIPAKKPEAGAPVEPEPEAQSREEFEVSTIPEEELPPFSPEYGIYTPGFQEFAKRHQLTAPQVAALVKRITKGV